MIFRRYLELSGINELVRDLRAKNIYTRATTLSTTGKTRGGVPFGRGALSYFLRNRFFIGEVSYKGEILPGAQPAILDKALFEAVQQKLSAHQSHKILTRQKADHLLRDLLFDDAGHRMIATHATKAGVIEVQRTQLVMFLKPTDRSTESVTLSVPWQKPSSKRFHKILLPHGAPRQNVRPERAERRARLVSAIARGRRWLDDIVAGSVMDAEQLARRERCTLRQINLTLSLAFLAPQLVKAAVEGRLPRGINIERLRDPDPSWTKQLQELGFDPN
jgi:hypothetical protein